MNGVPLFICEIQETVNDSSYLCDLSVVVRKQLLYVLYMLPLWHFLD